MTNKLIIFYSGEENLGRPEVVLGDECNLMLTFHNYHVRGNRPDKRFKEIYRARKKARERSRKPDV